MNQNTNDISIEKVIERATIDAYNEYEKRTDFLAYFNETIDFPVDIEVLSDNYEAREINEKYETLKWEVELNSMIYSIDLLEAKVCKEGSYADTCVKAYRKWLGY